MGIVYVCVCVCVEQTWMCGYVCVLSQASLSWLYPGVQLQENKTWGKTRYCNYFSLVMALIHDSPRAGFEECIPLCHPCAPTTSQFHPHPPCGRWSYSRPHGRTVRQGFHQCSPRDRRPYPCSWCPSSLALLRVGLFEHSKHQQHKI